MDADGSGPALRRALLALTLFATLPAAAPASDASVTCLNAWGQTHPALWCEPGFIGALSPTDQFGRLLDKGTLIVRGHGPAGAMIDVAVTDGSNTVNAGVPSLSVNDAGTGNVAGDFVAEMKVTNLGSHRATPGATPASKDPNDYGPSVLRVSALPHGADPETASRTTVVKFAATYRDLYDPLIVPPRKNVVSPTWPPADWCHGNLFVCPIGTGPEGICLTLEPLPGILPPIAIACNKGEVAVSGFVEDDYADAYGKASEIADIRIKITQGTRVLREFSDIARTTGTRAQWYTVLRINDFEPNYPSGDKYQITVTITDAWGHEISTRSPLITVYPW